MGEEVFWVIREVGTGIITGVLAVLIMVLGRYTYTHRRVVTRDERDARNVAFGLLVLFTALLVRAGISWGLIYAARREGFDLPAEVQSPWIEIISIAIALLGAVYCLRSFYPFPVWLLLLAAASTAPLLLVFT